MKRHDRSLLRAESSIVQAVRDAGSDRQALVGGVADVLARDLKETGRKGAGLLSAVSALAALTADLIAGVAVMLKERAGC
ncbi:MAG: hypothetical protein ACHQ51_05010 [Elusimicrobiota bacterium]